MSAVCLLETILTKVEQNPANEPLAAPAVDLSPLINIIADLSAKVEGLEATAVETAEEASLAPLSGAVYVEKKGLFGKSKWVEEAKL